MSQQAAITITRGKQFPGERERVYRLRSGARGAGEILREHRARGGQRAYDAALDDCRDAAEALGYEVIAYLDAFDPLNG
jgi:hypothetical protein